MIQLSEELNRSDLIKMQDAEFSNKIDDWFCLNIYKVLYLGVFRSFGGLDFLNFFPSFLLTESEDSGTVCLHPPYVVHHIRTFVPRI